MTWTTDLQSHETAPQVLTRLLNQLSNDIKRDSSNLTYMVREFPRSVSIDVNGTELPSNNYKITRGGLIKISDELVKKVDEPKKEKKKKSKKKVLKKRDSLGLDKYVTESDYEKGSIKQGPKSPYKDACRQISLAIGAPNIDMVEIPKLDRVKLKVRSVEDVYARLEKMRRRAQYELKSLREIHEDMKSTTNLRTKISISLLEDLYNKGKGRSVDVVLDMLFISIVQTEKDKMFYVRRHPNIRILHKCQNESILESINILQWYFSDGCPIKRYAPKRAF